MKTRRFAQVRPRGCTCRQPWQVCPVCAGTPRAQMAPVRPAKHTTNALKLLGAVRLYLVRENVQEIEECLDDKTVVHRVDVEQALGAIGTKREGL